CQLKLQCKLSDVLFFFQAEDGIRDATVTGVQTCALPISSVSDSSSIVLRHMIMTSDSSLPYSSLNFTPDDISRMSLIGTPSYPRSEERRVGKECGRRWWW